MVISTLFFKGKFGAGMHLIEWEFAFVADSGTVLLTQFFKGKFSAGVGNLPWIICLDFSHPINDGFGY